MNYGTDINIFANGLPDFASPSLPAGSQRLSSKPALDLTLTEIGEDHGERVAGPEAEGLMGTKSSH